MEQTDETGRLGHMKMKTFFRGCYLTVAHTGVLRRISRTSNRSTRKIVRGLRNQESGQLHMIVAESVPASACAAEGREPSCGYGRVVSRADDVLLANMMQSLVVYRFSTRACHSN